MAKAIYREQKNGAEIASNFHALDFAG